LSLSEELRFEQGLDGEAKKQKDVWEGGNSCVWEEEQGSLWLKGRFGANWVHPQLGVLVS